MDDGFRIGEGYVEITAKVDKSQTEEAAQLAGASFESRLREAIGERMRSHRGAFARDAEEVLDPAGRRGGTRFGRSMTSAISDAFKVAGFGEKLTQPLFDSLAGALQSFAKSPVGMIAIGAVGVTIGSLIASGVSSALLAGLTGGLGAGGIGLGAWLLKDDPAIRSAAKGFVSTLRDSLQGAAGVLRVPFIGALDDFKRAVPTIMPVFTALFRSIAPAVQPLADGLIEAIRRMTPGLTALATRTGPFLLALAAKLPGMGKSLGKFFQSVADNWPRIQQSFFAFMHDVGKITGALAKTVVFIARWYTMIKSFIGIMRRVFLTGSNASQLLKVGLHWIASQLPGWFSTASHAVSSAIGKIVGFFKSLPGRVRSAISSLPGGVGAIITRAGTTMTSGAARLVSSVIAKIKTLGGQVKGTVTGAFSGAGGWLIGAGRAIVMGLVNGIRGAIGAAASAAASMAQAAVNAAKSHLHINSPSKLVAREIGRPFAQGMAHGVEQEMPTTQRKVAGMVAGMVPAVARSTTTDNSRTYGATNITMHVHAAPGMSVDQLSDRTVQAIAERLDRRDRRYR